MEKIKSKEKPNKKLQLLNTLYIKEKYENGEKYADDSLIIVFRNVEKDEISYMHIKSPKIDFYVANEEPENNLVFIEKDKVTKHRVEYANLLKYIAENANLKEFYYDCLRNKQFKKLLELHQLKYLFASDIHIEDFMIGKFLDIFKIDDKDVKLTKAYFDIEVDAINLNGFPDEKEALAPINIISVYFDIDNTMHTFILNNNRKYHLPDNNLIMDFQNKYENKKSKYLKKIFEENNIDIDPKKVKISFYDDELNLIKAFFNTINKYKPNFAMSWNQHFDILTLINRIKFNNKDPEPIICHRDFPEETWVCDYYEDLQHTKHSEKNDSFTCTSYTKYLDQLIIYATLRVGIEEKESYALNIVAREDLGDEKLNYDDEGDIKSFPYENFEKFVCYNMKDVYLTYKLEELNQDISLMYSLGIDTRTRLEKAMRKTTSIKNMAGKFFSDNGLIIGNNLNAGKHRGIEEKINKLMMEGIIDVNGNKLDLDNIIENAKNNLLNGKLKKYKKQPLFENEDIFLDFGIPGGYVANPEQNKNRGINLLGQQSKWIYDLVNDFDLSSMYPSIISAFNLSIATQIGKIYFTNKGYNIETNPSGKFLSNLSDKNYIRFAQDWFNCPSIEEIISEVEK